MGLGSESGRPADWRTDIRIAMVGQRGLPATFGGIEHHVQELATRMVEAGHEVTVYCRHNYAPQHLRYFRGVRLVHPATVGTKHLDAIIHSLISTISALRTGYDIVHYHGLGPGLLSPIPRYLSRARVVQTVHGFDHRRAKWGRAAQKILTAAAWMSGRIPDRTIAVSHALTNNYRSRGLPVSYVPNGVSERPIRPADEIQRRWGLAPHGYLLFVGRLVPEKRPSDLIRSFRRTSGDTKLVIVGGSSYTEDYARSLLCLAEGDPRIIFTGWAYGSLLDELYSNAAAFVLPSSLEGLPLTLLEAASYGTPCVASDIACNVEVLGSAGPGHLLFPAGDCDALYDALCAAIENPAGRRQGMKEVRNDILRRYNWDDVTKQTLELYESLLG